MVASRLPIVLAELTGTTVVAVIAGMAASVRYTPIGGPVGTGLVVVDCADARATTVARIAKERIVAVAKMVILE